MDRLSIDVIENATNVVNIMPETHYEKVVADCMKDYFEYRKAEEQGLLLRLPCKVGNELFLSDYPTIHCRLKEYKFIGNDVAIVISCWEWQRTCTRMLSDIGKTIFLTKEEAEQALEQMKAGGEDE